MTNAHVMRASLARLQELLDRHLDGADVLPAHERDRVAWLLQMLARRRVMRRRRWMGDLRHPVSQ